MATVLHPRDLSGCEHRLFLDHAHPDIVRDRGETPEARRRKDAAADHRAKVREMIRGLHSDQPPGTVVVIDDGLDHDTRVQATLRACDDGAEWIWNATLPTDRARGRRGHSELLLHVDDGYLPIIVVNHRVSYRAKRDRGTDPRPPSTITSPVWTWAPTPDPTRNGRNQRRDQLRLAQLTAMLGDLRLSGSADRSELRGGVIGLDADCIVVYDMAPLLDEYERVIARRRAIADDLVATAPRRIGECRSCPWWPRCGPELEQRRDVSLVVGGNQAGLLDDIGVSTIDQLAHYTGEPPRDWPGNIPFDDAIINAIAWLNDTPLIRRLTQPRVARADVEVDVDMESYGELGAYMWGTLLTDNTNPSRPVRYRAFLTWQPLPTRDEARSFAEFWGWLMAERRAAYDAGKTFAAYCYSQQAENRWLLGSATRFAGDHGVPSVGEIEAFIGSSEWVDIYAAVGRNFICPNGKGLKRVAPVAGFTWRDAEAGGEASMDWYRDAVGLGGTTVDLAQRDRLLAYNEDDVRATKVLREWISDGAKDQVPHQDQLLAFRSHPHRTERLEERSAAQQRDGAEQ
ncbi:TM0106 family RecB-like putative nuclease [Gordonia sp. NPDC003424]